MATIYSKRLADVTQTTSPLTLYTVPAGFVTVVRSISLVIGGSGALGALERSGGTANIVRRTAAAANEFNYWEVRHVLNAGEGLVAIMTGTGSLFWYVSGYELQGP